jgi:hypothetical protein
LTKDLQCQWLGSIISVTWRCDREPRSQPALIGSAVSSAPRAVHIVAAKLAQLCLLFRLRSSRAGGSRERLGSLPCSKAELQAPSDRQCGPDIVVGRVRKSLFSDSRSARSTKSTSPFCCPITEPPGPGHDSEPHLHSNISGARITHRTDRDARLYREGPGKKARLHLMDHAMRTATS